MNEAQPLRRGFRFQTDLSDWWVRLRSGAVLRLWGSDLRITSDELQFGAVSANDMKWVELSAVTLVVVEEVVRGQGVNGSPPNAHPESSPVVWRRG